MLAFRPGESLERRVRAILLDTATGDATDVVVSLTRGAIDASAVLDTEREGSRRSCSRTWPPSTRSSRATEGPPVGAPGRRPGRLRGPDRAPRAPPDRPGGPAHPPQEEGNFDGPAQVGPVRTSLRPIDISQPEGPSFTVDGDEVAWEGWRLRIGFDAREGLTLHQLSLQERPSSTGPPSPR